MLENGAATIPDGDSIELLIAKGQSGELQQKQLIDLCNREMSKALTSQTLATEQGQNGSRAASETAHKRQAEVSGSDRRIIESSYNEMFARITQFNIGPDIPSPTLKLTRRVKPTSDMASILTSAAKLSNQVPVAEVHDKLGIRRAVDGEETVTLSEPIAPTSPLALTSKKPRTHPTSSSILASTRTISPRFMRC